MSKSISLLTARSSEVTMTSVEIAKLTGKEHRSVLRDIRVMFEELEIDLHRFVQIEKFANNREREIYALPEEECMILVSGYSTKLRASIIDRWRSGRIPLLLPQGCIEKN